MDQQKSIVELARALGRVARVLEGLAWFVGFGGMGAGVMIALRSQRLPWLAIGIAVVVVAPVFGVMLWTIGRLALVCSIDVLEPESRVVPGTR